MLGRCHLPRVGMGPRGGQDRGAWEKRLECSAGPSPMGLGVGASFTCDHVAGEGRVEAETSQAVGGHLPSAPLLPRSFRLLFIRRHPLVKAPVCFHNQSRARSCSHPRVPLVGRPGHHAPS